MSSDQVGWNESCRLEFGKIDQSRKNWGFNLKETFIFNLNSHLVKWVRYHIKLSKSIIHKFYCMKKKKVNFGENI